MRRKNGGARSTMQNVINEAHRKVADALVHGKRIRIAGETSNFWKKFLAAVKNLGFFICDDVCFCICNFSRGNSSMERSNGHKGGRQFHLG